LIHDPDAIKRDQFPWLSRLALIPENLLTEQFRRDSRFVEYRADAYHQAVTDPSQGSLPDDERSGVTVPRSTGLGVAGSAAPTPRYSSKASSTNSTSPQPRQVLVADTNKLIIARIFTVHCGVSMAGRNATKKCGRHIRWAAERRPTRLGCASVATQSAEQEWPAGQSRHRCCAR
jgi:hypothetical protein